MQKKVLSVLCIFSLLTALVSCTSQLRIDFSELLKRTQKQFPELTLDMENAFYSDGEWFLFVSLCAQDDILLTASADENGCLTCVGISAVRIIDCEEQKKSFIEFSEAAAGAFMGEISPSALLNELGLYDESLIFSQQVRFSEYGRFSASFFNADVGSTVRITIN